MRNLGGREPAVVVENDHGPLLGLESIETPLQLFSIGNGIGVVADRGVEPERPHLL